MARDTYVAATLRALSPCPECDSGSLASRSIHAGPELHAVAKGWPSGADRILVGATKVECSECGYSRLTDLSENTREMAEAHTSGNCLPYCFDCATSAP